MESLAPLLHVAVPAVALLVNVPTQILGMRLGLPYVRSVAAAFLAGLVLVLFAESVLCGPDIDALALGVVNLTVYCLLSYAYCVFVTLNVSSLRIRILVELESHPDGMSAADILGRYNADSIREARLARLLSSGQIVRRDGRLFLAKPHLVPLVVLVDTLRVILFGKRSL